MSSSSSRCFSLLGSCIPETTFSGKLIGSGRRGGPPIEMDGVTTAGVSRGDVPLVSFTESKGAGVLAGQLPKLFGGASEVYTD